MVITIFVIVYVGMVRGRLPGLALDRPAIALLGAVALLVTRRVSLDEALVAVDVPTLGLLFGLMLVSGQFRVAGAYSAVTRYIAAWPAHPQWLLAAVILVCGLLSALLANDIVCLAVTPLLAEGTLRRGLDPKPHLLAVACASNIGSAATLIGNPQNMLIGQRLHLSFLGYLGDGVLPAAVGLLLLWLWLRRRADRRTQDQSVPSVDAPAFDAGQAVKGIVVLAALLLAFLCTAWPRELIALAAGGVMLVSRRVSSRRLLRTVDWRLLLLFIGLFVVNHALAAAGYVARALEGSAAAGIPLAHPPALFAAAVVLSNLVSNVPAVMLLLPAATHPSAGAVLALASTLAGNLFIVGSIANIIVVDQARRAGVNISWREHARVGVPVTLMTLVGAAGWLWWRVQG